MRAFNSSLHGNVSTFDFPAFELRFIKSILVFLMLQQLHWILFVFYLIMRG